jgi:protein SCO1/2
MPTFTSRSLRIATLFSVVVVATGLVGTTTAVASGPAQPPSSVGVATQVKVTAAVANAKFIDQSGRTETLGALKGKTIFLVPFLTLCGDTCPFTTGNLLQLQTRLNADHASNIEVIAIDVDPYRDTPSRLAAYAKLIGANFQLWTEAGATSTPYLTLKELEKKNPVGNGDRNANLTLLEKFFGWTVQVVPQDTPPPNDWMAPHDQLTYDINHSDRFWIINANQSVRYVSGDLPAFTGKLSVVLSNFMGYKSNIYNAPVYKGGWTPAEAVRAIEWVTGKAL